MSVDLDPRLIDEPPTNGHLVTLAPPVGPRVMRRVVWLDLNDDCYPGFRLQVWLNPSHAQKRLADTAGDDDARVRALVNLIVLAHNGWCDEDGQPYPPVSEPGFWDAIPGELTRRAFAAIEEAFSAVPNSGGARSSS